MLDCLTWQSETQTTGSWPSARACFASLDMFFASPTGLGSRLMTKVVRPSPSRPFCWIAVPCSCSESSGIL